MTIIFFFFITWTTYWPYHTNESTDMNTYNFLFLGFNKNKCISFVSPFHVRLIRVVCAMFVLVLTALSVTVPFLLFSLDCYECDKARKRVLCISVSSASRDTSKPNWGFNNAYYMCKLKFNSHITEWRKPNLISNSYVMKICEW